jgi:hypothetical protein
MTRYDGVVAELDQWWDLQEPAATEDLFLDVRWWGE